MKDRSDDPSHHERTLLPRSYFWSDQSPTIHIYIYFFLALNNISIPPSVRDVRTLSLLGQVLGSIIVKRANSASVVKVSMMSAIDR